jgi:GTP-binding protein
MTQIRNIAIIAHVDHGKTTMVDQLLRQSGTFADHEKVVDTVMDNNAIERERGITILAKNCAVSWKGTHINIVDTPGHADFGGEVERALSMVDGVVLLIDAQEGPMPQTRFVTKKALALGLRPILVVNKVDKPGANPDKVVNAAFDLFDKLGATDDQLDFPVVYASGINGWSSMEEGAPGEQWGPDMSALFDTILRTCRSTKGDPAAPLQLQISALDYSSFVGRIGVGRVNAGTIRPMMDVLVMEGPDGKAIKGKVNQVLTFQGLARAGQGSRPRRHRADQRHRGHRHRRDHHRPAEPGAAADAEDRRADADDELLRQHQPAGRPRRQVRHQPPDLGPPAEGTAVERGAARQARPTRKACSK